MNKLLILSVLVVLSTRLIGQEIKKEKLIGLWQVHQHIADGWANNYQIFSNGTFKFNYSQMDCLKRVIYLKGDWILKNDSLILEINEKMIVEGGIIMEDPICDSLIEDGIYKTIKLTSHEIQKFKVTLQKKALLNDYGPEIDHIKLNSDDYYKIRESPNDY